MLLSPCSVPTFTLLVSGLLLSTALSLNAQNEDLSDTMYFRQLQEQYDLLLEDTSTIKTALRIKTKLLSKLDQHGSMIAYNQAMSNPCGDFCADTDLADWNYLGMPVYNTGPIQWNGLVGEVLANPANVNTTTPEDGLCLGSPTSGIFRFDASLPAWVNHTDNLESPALGINKILRNPADPNHLIAATGMAHTDDYGGGMGLITSLDGGLTWSPWVTSNAACFDLCKDNITGLYYHIDHTGNPSDLNHAFYITVRQGARDILCSFCAITANPGADFFPLTPPWGPNTRIADFTVNQDGSVLVTTVNPWGYDTEIWRGIKDGNDCGFIAWTNVTSNLQNAVGGNFDPTMNQFITLSDSKNNIVFARTKGAQSHELYRSLDGGLTWERRMANSAIGGRSFTMIEYSPATQLVYIGGVRLHVWDDANGNFHSLSGRMHVDVRDIDFAGINSAGQEVAYIANDGGVSECIYDPAVGLPGGLSFRPISGNDMPIQQFWGIAITQDDSGNYAAGAMHNNSFARVGSNFCRFGGGDGGDIEINPVDNTTVYFSINPTIRKANINNICNIYGPVIGTTSQWQFSCPLELNPNSPCLLYYGDDASGSPSAELKIYNDCGVATPTTVVPLTNVTGNSSGHYLEKIGAIGLTEAAPAQVILGNRDYIEPNRSGKLLKIDNYAAGSWQDLSHNPVTNRGNLPFKDYTAWLWLGDIVVSPYDKDLFFVAMQGTNEEIRVLRTEDGGATFEDWSDGLPYVPVNNLEYLYNSDDLILAATDAGVYYRTSNMLFWECFNEGFPLVWTTDIDVNYCQNKAVATTHGRGIYETSLDNLPRVNRQLEITGNVVWNKDRVVYSDVVVKPGAVLTITGALVKFAADKRILVEAGGRLNLNSAELTTLCEDSCWNGITVEGNTSLPQNNNDQGFAFISGSTLAHARTALEALGVNDDFSQLDYNQMGGMLTVANSTFLNNRRAVQLVAYENNSGGSPAHNTSSFTNCQFLIDDDYRDNCGSNEGFITMFDVDGVLITGSTFRDDRTGLAAPEDFRTGIKTSDATFRVIDNGAGPNLFENLYRGINAEQVNADNPFTLVIEDAVFHHNATGIRLADVNNDSRLLRNDIYIGTPLTTDAYGIVLHNSSGFTVEENYCRAQPGASGFLRGFDILNTYNPGNPPGSPVFTHHLVNNNIAQNLSEGFTAWGDNVADNNVDGLEFRCNQNLGNQVDFHFLNCIQPDQGSAATPAGNTFSCGSAVAFLVDPAAAGCITYFHELNASCTNTFGAAYPAITFAASNNTAGCSYLTEVSAPRVLAQQVQLFPNPTRDVITVALTGEQPMTSVRVFTLQGVERVELAKVPAAATTTLQLDIRRLPAGIYYLRVGIGTEGLATKIFVKH
ncbi:MAG: T9SS type A sorting domain-containing protein [Lewinella sp.]|nr:T9SS type A sorting domain-containing protein [Lewinella sp.]